MRQTRSLTTRAGHACAIAALVFALAIASAAAAPTAGRHPRTGRIHATSKPDTSSALIGGDSKTDCVYSANSTDTLQSFEEMVNRTYDCVLVFNDAAPSWAGWDDPWFLSEQGNPNADWESWVTAPGTQRELIITQGMIPSDVSTNWLQAGAAGAYTGYARTLARNLVAAGLGDSVIRLGHEANDSGSPWFIGTTAQSWRLWDAFWRRTVVAMRSVPGAHFLFDWCINAYWEPTPLADWYPGNDFVNIIGIDAYDMGVQATADRWSTIYGQPNGISDVLQFAAAHGKPVSFPEWGLWTPGAANGYGGGDDPAYINGLASVVADNDVAYQSYFYHLDSAAELAADPLSLAAYVQSFGG